MTTINGLEGSLLRCTIQDSGLGHFDPSIFFSCENTVLSARVYKLALSTVTSHLSKLPNNDILLCKWKVLRFVYKLYCFTVQLSEHPLVRISDLLPYCTVFSQLKILQSKRPVLYGFCYVIKALLTHWQLWQLFQSSSPAPPQLLSYTVHLMPKVRPDNRQQPC